MAKTDYVRTETADFHAFTWNPKTRKRDTIKTIELLWGDQVRVVGNGRAGKGEARIKARGREGFVTKSALGGKPLLEVYFIDVGQGDGVLIVTPDRKHLLIDGGWPRSGQPTGKNAADFVDWKFASDYGKRTIDLDAVFCSHNDQDHYGGLWDLFRDDPEALEELRIASKKVRVERFYHAGLSWWRIDGKRSLGRSVDTDAGRLFTDLIDSRNSVLKGLKAGATPPLQGEWAEFLRAATGLRNKAGAATPFQRLGHADEYVPAFGPGDGDVAIRVLAPVDFEVGGKPAIRYYDSGSKSTNGNSLLLRLDYGRSRILLTGDLNTKSMQALLDDWSGQRQELQCDVAKACHHGSDDVSYEFLAAMEPAVTIISSGDNEGHDHPRPDVVAASATTGYLDIRRDKIVTPLVYSTELARSVRIGKMTELRVPEASGTGTRTIDGAELEKVWASAEVTMAGDRAPVTTDRPIGGSLIVTGTIYGLVNVRTDGETIRCATMNEKDHTWQVKTIESRF